jgi:hypothetical protein
MMSALFQNRQEGPCMIADRARCASCVGVAALALALVGCSKPMHSVSANLNMRAAVGRAGPAPAASVAVAMADPTDSTDPGAPQEPTILSTGRDDRTLNEDHPYRARHGLADCESDCSVHEAGYKWAALHALTDARLCVGRERGFVVGCRAYVGDHRGRGAG